MEAGTSDVSKLYGDGI